MEKSVASGCNTSQTVQEHENTEVECKTPIKKAGGRGRMKASRADGYVKIQVVGVSGRTHQRKASIDEEKKSVERKEMESTCVTETEGYGDSDQDEIIIGGKGNKIKEDEKSVMEIEMDQVPVTENHNYDGKWRASGSCNRKHKCDRKGRGSEARNGKPDCYRKGRTSGHSKGKPEFDGKRRGSD